MRINGFNAIESRQFGVDSERLAARRFDCLGGPAGDRVGPDARVVANGTARVSLSDLEGSGCCGHLSFLPRLAAGVKLLRLSAASCP